MSDSTDTLQADRDSIAGEPQDPSTTPSTTPSATAPRPRRRAAGNGLAAMVLPELQAMAAQLGISGTGRLRKSQLIEAIQARQGGVDETARSGSTQSSAAAASAGAATTESAGPPAPPVSNHPESGDTAARERASANGSAPATADATAGIEAGTGTDTTTSTSSDGSTDGAPPAGRPEGQMSLREQRFREREQRRRERAERAAAGESSGDQPSTDRPDQGQGHGQQGQGQQGQGHGQQGQGQQGQGQDRQQGQGQQGQSQQGQGGQGYGARDDDDFAGGGGRRRGRFRERGRNRNRPADRFAGGEAEPVLSDDDVLIPVAGILDILDNYGFVRTSGYLTGPNDVYVSLQQVRKYGLRRGDAVTGAVRQQREGERKDKFNALVRLDTVNGMQPDEALKRPEFTKLTPLYPQDRLRLETDSQILTSRIIDLVMPIGKGQRALIVSPPKAGKTMVLQAIANAVAVNNPECHLMVVLVDERPEEVTDMQRSVKGEVIASTFDRPPSDHTTVAELSIERAKRLVELGNDVVVLLDSITRLGRAYNLAAPASGRILSGGVDSTALYPPKRFLGAARNIEDGGSLTIIATALVETGSTMDTVIFEEFKGTGNAELKLDRRLADKRIFPAIDVDASGTRKEEILLAPEELRIVLQLRRVLHALESGPALELLMDKMKNTRSNVEFLMQIQKTTQNQD